MPLYDVACRPCGTDPVEMVIPLADFDKALPPCTLCGLPMQRQLSAPRVMSDLPAYRAAAADIETGQRPMITSRSQHREFLKRNDYVELGNEMPKRTVPQLTDQKEIGRQIKRVMDEKGIKA